MVIFSDHVRSPHYGNINLKINMAITSNIIIDITNSQKILISITQYFNTDWNILRLVTNFESFHYHIFEKI